ncbi:MAG: hypothetical protein NVV63_02455 [Opitutus sp.]|nr:hypothetical protein [Opitutus sp.]
MLPLTVQKCNRDDLGIRSELCAFDLSIFDKRPIPGNKPEYRQPIHVYAVVEHENGDHPEEEFWKMVHFYAPLKVVVFYSRTPEHHLEGFRNVLKQANAFHARNKSEEYLAICTSPGGAMPKWTAWLLTGDCVWSVLKGDKPIRTPLGEAGAPVLGRS